MPKEDSYSLHSNFTSHFSNYNIRIKNIQKSYVSKHQISTHYSSHQTKNIQTGIKITYLTNHFWIHQEKYSQIKVHLSPARSMSASIILLLVALNKINALNLDRQSYQGLLILFSWIFRCNKHLDELRQTFDT